MQKQLTSPIIKSYLPITVESRLDKTISDIMGMSNLDYTLILGTQSTQYPIEDRKKRLNRYPFNLPRALEKLFSMPETVSPS